MGMNTYSPNSISLSGNIGKLPYSDPRERSDVCLVVLRRHHARCSQVVRPPDKAERERTGVCACDYSFGLTSPTVPP